MNAKIKPPTEWPKTGLVTVRYEDEIQDVRASRYGSLTDLAAERSSRKNSWTSN